MPSPLPWSALWSASAVIFILKGTRPGAKTLVDIVVTHDLQVTFTDDRLNAQIQLRRVQNDLDRGRLASTAGGKQASVQKRGAGADASESTPEKKIAGNAAHQQVGEVFLDAGAAPFDFDKKNEINYFVRTITFQGEQRIYWGKDFQRALEEAGAKVGDSIYCDSGGEQTGDSGGNPGAARRLKTNREDRCQTRAVAGG